MRKMQKESKTTFVFSTHDTRIIGEVDIVHTLEDGRLSDGRQQPRVEGVEGGH
jgi:putative ABC transport system ATP-binding protein